MKSSRLGLIMVLISGFAYGITPGMVAHCYTQGATPQLVIFFRYLILSLALIPMVMHQANLFSNYKKYFVRLLPLSLASAVTPILLYTSYHFLPTGIATTLHFMYPILVALICFLVFHDRLSKLNLLCLILCISGILLMMDLSSTAIKPIGIMIALLSGLTWAIYIVDLGKLNLKGVTSQQLVFYIAVNTDILVLIIALATQTFTLHLTAQGWGTMLGADFIAAIFGTMLFSLGVRHTNPQISSIASTLEPITSILVGVLFLHELLTVRNAIGCILILTAVILLSVFGSKE